MCSKTLNQYIKVRKNVENINNENIFNLAIESGWFCLGMWIYINFNSKIYERDLFRIAKPNNENAQIDLINKSNKTFRGIGRYGNVSMMHHFRDEIIRLNNVNRIIDEICIYGHLECIKWFENNYYQRSNIAPPYYHMSYESVIRDNFDTTIYLILKIKDTNHLKNIFIYSSDEGRLNVLEWGFLNNYLFEKDSDLFVASTNLEILKFLDKKGAKFTQTTILNSASNFENVKWLLGKGCNWDISIVYHYLNDKKNVIHLQWFKDNGYHCDDGIKLSFDNPEILNWFILNGIAFSNNLLAKKIEIWKQNINHIMNIFGNQTL